MMGARPSVKFRQTTPQSFPNSYMFMGFHGYSNALL